MCGIVGVCNRNRHPVPATLLKRMTDAISHRGPDSEGHYIDGPVGLGHRRLSIIDLSAHGHQPMANETGDVIVVYNGEIYNFAKLRVELEAAGHCFHSQTDTEVVVHAYEEWGEACVGRFNGMFAFAIWDGPRRRLFLARDRYGVKPVYWYFRNDVFVFASEIKAILLHPAVSRGVCTQALNEYFSFQNIYSDLTLFEAIRILPPASTLRLDLRDASQPVPHRYWDYPLGTDMLTESEDDCVAELHHLVVQAVTRQLMSDVPVGAFLSGGIDSGSITAVASGHVARLHTFTGGFDLSSASGLELGYDERRSAECLANLFKTEHYEVVMHAGDMEAVLPELIWHLEDLRVGQSYPNYYVSRLASKFVKVALSGVGGDELFGGYPWRYHHGLDSLDAGQYMQRYYQFWQRLVPEQHKAELFTADVYRDVAHHSTFDVFREVYNSYPGAFRTNADFVNASLYFELKTFLHGILVVEDKISMTHSLETRVPFLDNDLVDFAMRIPPHYKLRNVNGLFGGVHNGQSNRNHGEFQTKDGKVILRSALGRLIPADILARTKQGFSAPDASWFRGESIDYINRLLRDPKARLREFINPGYVNKVLDVHCSGQSNQRLLIWSMLSFEWWLRRYFGDSNAAYAPISHAA
jgi:asparagine synthase (glutamine-hydrolysing)